MSEWGRGRSVRGRKAEPALGPTLDLHPRPRPPTPPPRPRSRVYQYYLPVFAWVKHQAAAHAAGGGGGPLVVGVSAPQGCGKTTLVAELEALAPEAGLAAASVSIDDFYLTRAEQAATAAASGGNPLLELRGNAGTHDLALGTRTLDALIHAPPGATVPLPRYDKAAFGGLGDRAPEQGWPSAAAPVDVILLEGWMLGFAPVGGRPLPPPPRTCPPSTRRSPRTRPRGIPASARGSSWTRRPLTACTRGGRRPRWRCGLAAKGG